MALKRVWPCSRTSSRRPVRSLHWAATGLVVFAWMLAGSVASSSASRVMFVSGHGHVTLRDDPALSPNAITPAPQSNGRGVATPLEALAASSRTVVRELSQLEQRGHITQASYLTYRRNFDAALAEVKGLSPAAGAELEAVINDLHDMAVAGTLTAARLPVLFLTLNENSRYWKTGPALSYGERVEFRGSELVWEYYPGQGLQLQQLGSFGKADWLCTAGDAYKARCHAILAELIPLAVRRGGGLAWEYYFRFDGGIPPWTSAMSQATALQALADAYRELGDRSYLAVAHGALPLFNTPPPTGVAVKTSRGTRYVQYSFAPDGGQEVINAFLQTLIGLDVYARASGDPVAERLFSEGNAEAQMELPKFNTGAWSLYQPGEEDDLSYHELVTGFLQQLCSITKVAAYCLIGAAFHADLTTPPQVKLRTTHVAVDHAARLYFALSKISRVGITILHNSKTVFLTSAPSAYGAHGFAIPPLKAAGVYTVRIEATDLASNYAEVSVPLQVGG